MHDQGVEVVSEAAGGSVIAVMLELADDDLEAELAVLDAGRLADRAPIVEADGIVF